MLGDKTVNHLSNFRDIMTIYNEPPPGMCIVPDKDDITKVCIIFRAFPGSELL